MTATASRNKPAWGSPEWHAERRKRLGASEIPAVVGLSTHATPHDVWAVKVGEREPDPETPAMRHGTLLEPIIADEYTLVTGHRVLLRSHESIAHPDHPWLVATPDAEVLVTPSHGLQIKGVGVHAAPQWGENDTAEVPPAVAAQVTIELGVARACGLGWDSQDVACWTWGKKLKVLVVEWDEEFYQELFERARAFWFDHVLARVPPPLDGSDAAWEFLRRRYPREELPAIPAPPDAAAIVSDYEKWSAIMKQAEDQKTLAQQKLVALIGKHEGIYFPGCSVTYKTTAAAGTDWKAVAEAIAADLVEFAKPGTLMKDLLDAEAAEHQRPGYRRFHLSKKVAKK